MTGIVLDIETTIWLIVLVGAVGFTLTQVVDLLAHRRPQRRRPMSADSCRTCDKPLRHGRIWEQREHLDNVAGMPDFGGGTFMAITYCRRHRPRGSIRT